MEIEPSAIEFRAVSKRYPRGALALEDVTWSVAAGSRTCLLGPNGAGKSTCIRLLEGAIGATEGRVLLLGSQVGSPGYLEARRRTGVVPQGPGMYADLSVADYLGLALRLYRRGDLPAAVSRFGLEPYLHTRLAELSGGFQRRTVLAAALLAEPDVLLLDEPTVGLDPVAAHDVHEYLKASMAGRTTVLCTHNLAEAEALCDEVVILRGGRVLVQQPLQELKRRSRSQLRLAARQGRQPLLEALRDRGLAAGADGEDGALVDVERAREEAPALLRSLLASGLDVYECTEVRPGLEALFLDLVGRA
jgi:ABC-2 type transport system ATP-binding protein